MNMDTLKLKRGDTFGVQGFLADDDGVTGVDLGPYNIRSHIRSASGILLEELVVTKLDQSEFPGRFSLSCGDTSEWPLSVFYCDIEYDLGGNIMSTDSVAIQVIRDETI